jgi:parvulin-like peptidyl-prolyl isomerase
MLREAAASEGRKRGLSISETDIEGEYDFTLQAEHLNGKDIEKLTPVRRDQMIEEWTRSRNVTREELRIAMERQAWLRKIIGPPAPIDEADLKKEYERVHGEKVEIRHLQLAAPRFFPPIKARLDKGESFESLVREYSQNAYSRDRGGLLPPFSINDDTVTSVLAKAAFALKVGEYSNPIESLGAYHVIKLEKHIPPDGVSFDQARATLLRHMEARRLMQAMQDLGSRLLMQAELRIEDPVLREQYKKAQAAKQIAGPILVGQ